MNRCKLVISSFAELDLQIASEWYELQKEGLGSEFINEVEKVIFRIKSNPHQFRKVRKQIRMAITQKFPFGVYFILKGDTINVFAVFHFSRNPQILKKRSG